jgi:hypothetical protein
MILKSVFLEVDRDSWLRGRWWKWVCWFLIIPTDSGSTVILNTSSLFSAVVSKTFRCIYPSNGIYFFT